MSDKTEDPTPRRLRKAREEGDSGASAFASQSVAFLAAVALLPAAAAAVTSRVADDLRAAIAHAAARPVAVSVDPVRIGQELLALSAPVLLAALVAGAAAQVVQTGGFLATKKLSPKLERLSPLDGWKQLVSGARLFAVARAMLGAAIVGYLAYRALRAHAADLAHASGRIAHAGVAAGALAHWLLRDAALAGLAIAVVDIVIVRRGWHKRLRMTKEEIKREHKESEGDPQIKQARERAYHEVLASTAVANVRHASVVVVNPTHLACALRYATEEGDEAPVVVASGEGDLAARIVRAAHDYGVPVVRDVPLARALRELAIGDEIPEALYEAVAEILREAWEESGKGAGSA
jgi:flagellar biosynthesis protein FlhB